jgi:hypothetical protein
MQETVLCGIYTWSHTTKQMRNYWKTMLHTWKN